jgi:hypothetical protein
VQEAVLKLGEKTQFGLLEEPIELEGILHDIDGTVMHGKIPSLQETIMLFLMEFIIQSQDSIEPVTAQDGLRVMQQIIEANSK